MASSAILSHIEPHLQESHKEKTSLVVMTCGIAGSGKSTLAHAIVAKYPNFTRLSIDHIIYSNHGVYGVDYPRLKHEEYQEEAHAILIEQFSRLLQGGQDIVLDLSLWSRAIRDQYRDIIENHGGRWLLVYFDAPRDVLWRRIQQRSVEGVKNDTAFEVTEEVLDRYIAGFEKPNGEGEVVIQVSYTSSSQTESVDINI